MEMITLSTELNIAEADLKLSRLEAAGFHPTLTNTDAASWMGCAGALGGMLVQVPENDAEGKDTGDYTVSHTGYVYLMDASGKYLAHVDKDAKAEDIAQRLRQLKAS